MMNVLACIGASGVMHAVRVCACVCQMRESMRWLDDGHPRAEQPGLL